MADPKPIASLTPRLLARKGGAKPAMRRQTSALAISHDEFGHEDFGQDDLGWNDMGHDHHDHAPRGEVVPIGTATILPEVLRQQRSLGAALSADRSSALAAGRRAAFTLRVDAERHLKLRLACTVRGRSAQQLVTEALDRLLDELPQLNDLAALAAQSRP